MKRLLALLAVMVIGLAVPAPASADEKNPGDTTGKSAATVQIRTASATGGDDRGAYDYDEVQPKGVIYDWVSVTNLRTTPITLRLFAKDATSTADSPFAVQDSAATPHDLGAWITLQHDKITIPGRTERIVQFQVGVPANATPGDHAAGIMVSLLTKEPRATGGEPVIVDHRVGMRVHLRVPGDLRTSLAVENLKVSWNGQGDVLGRGDADVSYQVRNTGNLRTNVDTTIELSRILGLPGVNASAPQIVDLLPGGTTQVHQVVRNVLGTGPMKANIHLHGVATDPTLKASAVDVTKTQGYGAWPWLLIAEIIGLLLLLGAGGWFERRRRKARTAKLAELAASEEQARASAKHRMLVRAVLAPVVVLGTLLVPGTLAPANADAGDQWKATITKKEGIALEPFDIETSGGCPLPATAMVGFGFGKGFPKTGAVVVSNTEGGVTNERGFTAALVDSMKNIMALQPDPRGLSGEYKFVIRCIKPEFPDKSYGEYVAGIKFDSLDHWVALPPLSTKKGPIVQITQTGPNGEPKSSPGASPTAGQGAPGGTASGNADATQRAGDLLGTSAPSKDDSGPSWPLLALGVVVLLGSLALAFGRRIPGPWRRS